MRPCFSRLIGIVLIMLLALEISAQEERMSVCSHGSTIGPKQLIVDAFNKAKGEKTYVLDLTYLNEASEIDSRTVFEIALPNDRMMAIGSEGFRYEVIKIGDDVYSSPVSPVLGGERSAKPNWEKSKSDLELDVADMLTVWVKSSHLMTNVEFIGQVRLENKLACLVQYDFHPSVVSSKELVPISTTGPDSKVTIWISERGLPLQIEYKGRLKYSNEKGKILKRVERFEFREVIIRAPKI